MAGLSVPKSVLRSASGGARLPRPARLLRGKPAPRGRHGRKRVLRLRQGTSLDGHRGRLRGDRDLFARRRIAALAGLRRLLHPHGELDDTADLHLLGVGELVEDDFLERVEHGLGLALAETGAVGDFTYELTLGKRHEAPSVAVTSA